MRSTVSESEVNGVAPFGMLNRALPYLALSDVARVLASTSGTLDNTVRPAASNQVFKAIVKVAEVDNCVVG